MTRRLPLAPLALLAALALPATAMAGPVDDIVRLDLLPGWRAADGTQMAGFRVSLAPGWKTYWRAPGEAGIPPQVDWSGSDNVAGAAFRWPVPEVFEVGGFETYGYSEQVVFPVAVTPARPGAPVRIEGRLEIGVCQDVCVPVSLDFAADLPQQERRDPALALALADRAQTPAEAGVDGARCAVSPTDDGVALTAELPFIDGTQAVVVETGDPALWAAPVTVRREGGSFLASTRISHVAKEPVALDRSGLVLTMIGDGEAVEFRGCAPA
ncbi:protein-disulfide reductase DsbD domain-containing protein [Limimaricola sp.]|uniref:protein-disulfide reductase DsbD domain-containing protein n=1 Tax=Limimaricola sp. TaxID=2211665 RepID=UPI0040589C10